MGAGQGLTSEHLVEALRELRTRHEAVAAEVFNQDDAYKRFLNEVSLIVLCANSTSEITTEF